MVTINNVETTDVASLWELATKLGVVCEGFDGSLVPNYLFYDAEKIEINGQRAKYIVCEERFKNSWQSKYDVILTNDINKVSEYESIFENDNLE